MRSTAFDPSAYDEIAHYDLSLGRYRTRALVAAIDGPGFLFFHGFGGNARGWLPVMERLCRGGCFVAAVDVPGCGDAAPLDLRAPLLPQHRAFVEEAVEHFSQRALLTVVGASVLAHAVAPLATRPDVADRVLLLDPAVELTPVVRFAGAPRATALLRRAAPIPRTLGGPLLALLNVHGFPPREDVVRVLADEWRAERTLRRLAESERIAAEVPRSIAFDALRPDMSHVSVWVCPDGRVARPGRIPAELITRRFPKLGHSPQLEAPDAIARALLATV